MVIAIYLKDDGNWSFRKQAGAKPLRVQVPARSRLKEVKSLGPVLFVPGADPLVSCGWNPSQVISEAHRTGGAFTLLRAARARRDVG
ncbi:Maf family protein [Singulisphaera acidiphila]|uniref:Uncharacterized protein n=1 Tax=Singulisphaera acidiphila (strain ATCC BAA-1392 / DSM 18658 / VKM B-2454 / MOB10) TaxID=886293 RepID=L0DGM8_SINAD|nr:hypothetical protein [Singulisphaera acidiphila]AGA28412.1 hypothetical protein Sinac_4208 [Singulisphaera acidiphila DSM 18658]